MIYDPADFPPITAIDTVVREGQALVLRYRLMRCLTDADGIRIDLRGGEPDPLIVAEMIRQLVPGVDAPLAADGLDWPIRGGVRLELLAYSPWLAAPVARERLGGRQLYRLPETADAFAALFERKTGIAPDSHAMERNYRITPNELGRIAMRVRGSGEAPSLAYLLLCSRHYDAAVEQAPWLGERDARLAFREPPIEGFRLLGELEREALTIEDLAVLNTLSAHRIRQLLDGDGRLLAHDLRRYPQLKRLLDYQMIGTDALGGYDNAEAAGIILTHPDLRAVAAAGGLVDVDVVEAVTDPSEAGAHARITLRAAFPDPEPGSRESFLANDDPAAFYGLNMTLAGAFQADLGKRFQHGDIHVSGDGTFERQAALAAELLAHADPRQHARHLKKTARMTPATSPKQPSGTNRQRDAIAHGTMMLPTLRAIGSAPRARVDRWGCDWSRGDDYKPASRWGDETLWRMLLDRDLGRLDLGLDEAERAEIVGAFDRLNELFGATLAVSAAAADPHGISDALHAVCDMATAVSAISTNRFIGRAIIAWLHALAHLGKNTNDTRSHGRRLAAGIPHIARVRQHKGVPSAGDVKPNPRKDRAATRKLKDLAATARKDD